MLQETVARLVKEFQPEEIYLFGSQAWGVPTAESDLDFYVIVRDSKERPIRRDQRAQLCLGTLDVSADILVRTRGEVEKARTVIGSLTNTILRKGRKLYG